MTESVAVSEIFTSKGWSGKDGIIIKRIVPKLKKQSKIPKNSESFNKKDSTETKKTTRMLQLQATVKRFQFDLYVNLEGQHMLISSWS